MMVTDPNLERSDPNLAVKLAAEVVELAPAVADGWNTLGLARYRAADFEGAIESLRKFRELRTDAHEGTNPFFLALSHWQLGKKDEARTWYEIAVNWMNSQAPTDKRLIRIRAEAAELLGVAE
jgi:tetratricopeptide (TPR) repeat protein